MNALTRDLIKLVDMTEEMMKAKEQKEGAPYREKLHLLPPVGWLNDPNGLCQLNGIYHAFFQYSPFNAEGGVKMWGHYTSKDMIDWEYQGVKIYPDQPFDCHGVYSGSTFIEDGKMYVYYTGNVKLEDGDFDYINTGREANTVLVVSEDGKTFGPKKELMRNVDYPSDLTCHVRDPKVWKEGDTYYMIQGARTKEDVGQALIFESKDKINWKFRSRVESEAPFGYMWECPDYFEVDGHKILSTSVQGLEGGIWDDRNVYQSGYFLINGSILEDYKLSEYMLWDYGFDYYAPQSFETEDGRRIHISWMGMPDCEEYTNPTIAEGWQHCFTFPREVFVEDGKTFGKKKELMRNSDYPDDLTCHVRDPKVWKENGTYYMVQGARTNEDVGQVLVFESEDKVNWRFRNRVESEKPFGYMWECPDYFKIGDKKLLSTSVQGLEGGIWEDCNVYKS